MVAIQGNDPRALTIDELDSSDMSDTLAEILVRKGARFLPPCKRLPA